MQTNYVKTRILPILDEIIAYVYNKSRIKKNNQPRKKFNFSTTSGEKGAKFEDFWQSNRACTKAVAKNCAFQKISRGKKKKLR